MLDFFNRLTLLEAQKPRISIQMAKPSLPISRPAIKSPIMEIFNGFSYLENDEVLFLRFLSCP